MIVPGPARGREGGAPWASARSARARSASRGRVGCGRSIRSVSPTSNTAPGWATTCTSGPGCSSPRSAWSGWASAWTGSAPCTAPGWCCGPISCGRRTPTTTPGRPRRACGGSTPWSGWLTASLPTRPRRLSSKSTGGACTGRASTGSEGRRSADGAQPAEELVASLTRLYCYLYGEPEAALRPAAVHRARAMDLSDQWIREGCQPDSSLLPLEHAALVRCYAALLAAVHR